MKVSIFHDPRKHKAWVVRWFGVPDLTSGNKKRYCKAFTTEVEALKFRAEQEIAFLGGRPLDRAEEANLKTFAATWLRSKRADVKPATYREYRRIAGRLIDYLGGECLLRQIGPQAAHQFIAELGPQAKTCERLSDWSRNTMLRYCRAMFADAVTWGLTLDNPFRSVKARKASLRAWHYLDVEQYRALLAACPSLRWKAIYALAYTCGLRFAELMNLQWQDIDFKQGILTVRNRPSTDATPPFTTKNNKDRTVPMVGHTQTILQQWQLQQGRSRIPYVVLTSRQYENVVERWKAYRKRRRPWENQAITNNVMREFRRHVRKAGIEADGTLTLHTLRKCAGKNWADCIRNPKVVQELMGHSSLSTTMKYYSKVNQDDMKKAVSGIDALLAGSDAKVTPDTASA